MRPIVVRDEEPPGDAAIVVRGGLLTRDSVHRGRVRAARFPIWPTNRYAHFSLVLPDLDETTLARLDAAFGRPQASPALPGS